MKKYRQKQSGFTIVELLIVVVVIAILAAITIVAYNGITQRSKESAVQADITNAAKKLETIKLQSSAEQYPATLTAAGISASSGNTFAYEYSSADNSYCLQSTNGSIAWYASSGQINPSVGTCGSDSLVGNWNFNGNTNDSTGNGFTATTAGTTLTTGQNGQANGAYSFPGSAAFINMGNSTQFDVPELTMSIWARPTSFPATQTLMAKEGKQKYRLVGATTIGVLASDTTGWTTTPTCPYAFSANNWYHIVLTISSLTGRMKVFVNGAQTCNFAGPIITGYNASPLLVGAYNAGGAEGFNGSLDDARFYKRALGAAEIKSLFDQGAR